ncbi:MAG: hypothetical protein ACPGEC_04460 [Flavobacteriales bacterium]
MKHSNRLVFILLIFSLFIYVFYRTEHILINKCVAFLVPHEFYLGLKSALKQALPLPNYFIFSLPGGLWVFCSSLLAQHYVISIGSKSIKLVFLPLIFSVGLEIFQALHWFNGRFDWLDVLTYFLFWMVAFSIRPKTKSESILRPFTCMLYCVFSVCI